MVITFYNNQTHYLYHTISYINNVIITQYVLTHLLLKIIIMNLKLSQQLYCLMIFPYLNLFKSQYLIASQYYRHQVT